MLLSKTVVKLIDQSIVPAILLVFAKVVSAFLLNGILFSNYQIESRGFLFFFPVIHYNSYQDYFTVNSASNGVMFAVVAFGAAIVLIKAHFLHQSHISPMLHGQLARSRLSRIVASNFHLYHQAVVWLIFLWLVTALLVFEAIFKISNQALAIFALIFAINSSWFLIIDVEHEIEIWNQRKLQN